MKKRVEVSLPGWGDFQPFRGEEGENFLFLGLVLLWGFYGILGGGALMIFWRREPREGWTSDEFD